jgi:hypothetical protein
VPDPVYRVTNQLFSSDVYSQPGKLSKQQLKGQNVAVKFSWVNDYIEHVHSYKNGAVLEHISQKIKPKFLKSMLPQFIYSADIVMNSSPKKSKRAPYRVIMPIRVIRVTVMEQIHTVDEKPLSLKTFLKQHTKKEDRMVLGVTIALLERAVWKLWMTGFFHGDLHLGNILMHRHTANINYPSIYKTKVQLEFVPCIIDFGFAMFIESTEEIKRLYKTLFLNSTQNQDILINYTSQGPVARALNFKQFVSNVQYRGITEFLNSDFYLLNELQSIMKGDPSTLATARLLVTRMLTDTN